MGFLGLLLVSTFSVSSLWAQDIGCSTLTSQYGQANYRNLSAGVANVVELRDLALRPLLAQTRVPGTSGNVLARTHIKTWMEAVGWTVTEDSFVDATPYGNIHFSNVIATLNPGKTRRVVLACHYDTKMVSGSQFLGATDSAVPCALLMDTALRLKEFLMAKKTSTSDLTVQFIFFDGEEAFVSWTNRDSLYGARHLAAKWAATLDTTGRSYLQDIEAFILLDLIGTADTHFQIRYPQTAPIYQKMQSIETCLRHNSLLTVSHNSHLPLFTSSSDYYPIDDDHKPFYERGVPVVHLITSPFPAVWHTGNDDIYALDFGRIDNLARVLRVYLADLPL